MPLPTPPRLGEPPPDLLAGASLFLDFDGTLVELAPRPDAVVVDDRLRTLLGDLSRRLDGRLAIVSGRSVEQIRALFGATPFAVSGSHGLEIAWPDGRAVSPGRPPGMDLVLAEMRAFEQTAPGLLVEDKPLGVALHYRRAPDTEAACHALAQRLARDSGLHLQPGKMMVELRPPGADKGAALRTLMGEPALAGTRPVFLGDDVTDESAFAAAAALGGDGVLVGPERPTAALWRLDGVGAVLDWLAGSGRT